MARSSLVPNISDSLGILRESFGSPQSRKQAKDLQTNVDILSGGTATGTFGSTQGGPGATLEQQEAALVRLSAINPQIANSIRQTLDRGDKIEAQQIVAETEKGTRTALLIQKQPDFISKQRSLTQAAQSAASRGESLDRFVELSNLSEQQLDLELQRMIIQGTDIKVLLSQGPATPGGEIIKSSEITDGFLVRRLPDGSITKTKVLETAGTSGATGNASAVTKVFDNGSVVQALPNGTVDVRGPDGKSVTGDARLEVLKKARKEEIKFAQAKSGSVAAGGAAIRQSEKAFVQLAKIKIAITNIDKAIDALDRGAETGPIISKLPSIRQASVELDNIQKAMGLDVIGNVTFGALSKGELDLALSKAVPTGLRPQALRKWLVDKKDAQEKLASYIGDAAIFLGTPGNTIAGWLEAQDAISEQGAAATEDVQQQDTTPDATDLSGLTDEQLVEMRKQAQ